jgi:hypothetical protein
MPLRRSEVCMRGHEWRTDLSNVISINSKLERQIERLLASLPKEVIVLAARYLEKHVAVNGE